MPACRPHRSGRQPAVAAQGGSDPGEGQEVVGLAFVATVQAAAPGQPRHRPLRGPTAAAQPPGGLDALASDARDDASGAESSAQVVVVVTLVGVEFGGPPTARSATGPNRRYIPHQGFQSLAVVGVRGGDADGEGQTSPLGDQVGL